MRTSRAQFRALLLFFAVSASLAAIPTVTYAVDFYDGLRAWESGEREEAIATWLQASASGDAKSSARIGEAFANGEGLSKQIAAAAYYYAIAGFQGDTDSDVRGAEILAALSDADQAEVQAKILVYMRAEGAGKGATVPTEDDLIGAILGGEIEFARTAIEGGLSPNFADDKGWTPLMYAALEGNAEMIGALIDAGASVELAGADGLTALHIAALSGSQAAAEALIDRGFHAAATTKDGAPASVVARMKGYKKLAAYLETKERVDIRYIQEKLERLGYEVGDVDGNLGVQTRDQLGIFGRAKLRDTTRAPTAALISKLMATKKTEYWGIGFKYWRDGHEIVTLIELLKASDKEAATALAIDRCQSVNRGERCTITFVVPEGSCIAYEDYPAIWTRAYPDTVFALEEAVSLCRKAGSTYCEPHSFSSFCVGG